MEAFLCFAGGSANCILLWRQTKYSKNSFTFVGSFSWHGNSYTRERLNFSYTIFFHIFLALIRCFFSFRRVYFQIWNCMPKQQKCLRLSCVCSFHHSAVVKYFSVAFCFLSLPVAAGQKQECGQKIFFSDLHWDIFLGLKSVLKYLKSISLLNALKYFLRFHLYFVLS